MSSVTTNQAEEDDYAAWEEPTEPAAPTGEFEALAADYK